MGKIEKLRKYRKTWEQENWAKGWLTQTDLNANTLVEVYCKVCCSYLRAHLTDLKRHTKTKTRSENMARLNPAKNHQSVLSNIVIVTNEQKTIDLKLAVYAATHTSIKSIDHLCEILKIIGKELVEDIGTSYFSLIVDESTDVSVFKN